jgi:pimeloyl-ACP methyl ester carboxylesterase
LELHPWQSNVYPPPSSAPNTYCAYTISPVDVSETWWFGFARSYDFRDGGRPGIGDTIVNYTEQRVLRMIDDLIRKPIGPAVDVNRIYVRGYSMGASGALAMALRYPYVFAAAHADKPMTNYRDAGGWIGNVEAKWGNDTDELPVAINAPNGWIDHLDSYKGASVWDWQNHQLHLQTRRTDAMVPLGITQGISDTSVHWDTQGRPLYAPLNASGQLWGAEITGDDHSTQRKYWGLPPDLQKNGVGIPFWGLQVVRNETVPGLADLSANLTTSPNITPSTTGSYNQTVRWSASWDSWDGAPVDLPLLWQMSFCSIDADPAIHDCGTGITQTVDITLRRVQQFSIKPNIEYVWRNHSLLDDSLAASGTITTGVDGLLTVPAFEITPQGNRLTVLPFSSSEDPLSAVFLPIVIKP